MRPEKGHWDVYVFIQAPGGPSNFDGAIRLLGDYDGISPIGDVRLESI